MSNKLGFEVETIPQLITSIDRVPNGPGVMLDHTLTASQARISPDVRRILTNILKEAIVVVFHEYFYRIDFGPDVYPQIHIVSCDLYCSCELESDCPAATAVKVYLQRQKGEQARIPDPGYFPAAPHYCPVCGARSFYDPELSSHHRGIGWHCSTHGRAHYWQHQAKSFRVVIPSKSVS
jgi:hypothetical protein